MLGYTFGALALVLVLGVAVIALTSELGGFAAVLLVLLLVPIAAAIGIGVLVGTVAAKARGRTEVGISHVLTAAWNEHGVRVSGENYSRSILVTDIRKVRRVRGFIVLQLRWGASMWAPWVVALPPDFVPPAILHRFGAGSVP